MDVNKGLFSLRTLILAAAAVIVVVAIGFYWIAGGPGALDFAPGQKVALEDYKGADPTGVPASLSEASLIERGEYLARAADCQACHTAPGGVPFAGGLAFKTQFGTMYSPNITADKETGIGAWSDAAFMKALREGVDDEGVHLYPAMPYASYTYMTDVDVLAIKAYLFSLAPVSNVPPANDLGFPFNQRGLMAIWSLLYNPNHRFEPNSAESDEWNRGAYLAEALAHCGDCHTPRNKLQALDNRRKYAGTQVQGWMAYNITSDETAGVGAWSNEALNKYLAAGYAEGHGAAAGPMAEAVDLSLSKLDPADIAAITTYLRSVPAKRGRGLPAPKQEPAPASHKMGVAETIDPLGKKIYEGACASCHGWDGAGALNAYATLTGARSVNDPSAVNLVQVVISGVKRGTPDDLTFMPSFGGAYSDTEIAALANYVTARFGGEPSKLSAKDVAALREQSPH